MSNTTIKQGGHFRRPKRINVYAGQDGIQMLRIKRRKGRKLKVAMKEIEKKIPKK